MNREFTSHNKCVRVFRVATKISPEFLRPRHPKGFRGLAFCFSIVQSLPGVGVILSNIF